MGGSKWTKARIALGLKLNSCLYVPRAVEPPPAAARSPGAESLSPATPRDSDHRVQMPTTPTPSSSGLRLPKQSSKSSKTICAICLGTMKPGHGHAIFTAECSHSFHFHCISSNVKHGRQSCPVCRAKWKEVPFQSPDKSHVGDRINNVPWPQEESLMRLVRRIPSPRMDNNRNVSSLFHVVEPDVFDDDDEICGDLPRGTTNRPFSKHTDDNCFTGAVEVKTYPEVSAVLKSKSYDDFSVLIHLKAPNATTMQHSETDRAGSRAPVDLVTVLDVSGSMAGTKLALLKRAMGFVIQNLGPSDRLSVIAFSSTARRLFPLRRMNHTGKHEALQAVNSLSSNGGTNIADGLRKGAKVLSERKCKNPVSSIILLSDGQDTYTTTPPTGGNTRSDQQSLLPASMHMNNASGLHIPVHAFGFGADHDAVSMHSISETSGGTFSFIEAENVIQDAFAQCIGGLLSVVVQELRVEIECVDPMLQLRGIKSGSYKNILASHKRKGTIEVGDLYAEEERDFLVTTDIPTTQSSSNEMPLIKVKCVYKHPISKNLVTLDSANEVTIQRPVVAGSVVVSIEVDKQRNRLQSAEAMAEARCAAEEGDLASAVAVLENCRKQLSESASARAGDTLCAALDAELREMQERMGNRQTYETSGRAYVLSGLSSHSWQRATARGDSTDSWSVVHAYQTPSMVDMVNLSQTMILGNPSPRPTIRPTRSFPARQHPS
ncbi:E3 ubiquitin-protein ligase WAV3-like [Salvia divinorum]|uniref:E3 ubiquitin-protein ligase WAV3-like n=1 Tax=Salvia divinorum TaxID=28513 RepID=A0ABD1GFL1_SALDI